MMRLPIDEICEKYQSGISTVKLAKEYGCAINTINKILRNNNIIIRTKNRLNLPIEKICQKYQYGMNIIELADEYGCSTGSINKILHDNKVVIRSHNETRIIDLPIKEICQKYLNGMSTSKLAITYKCSINTINKRLRDNDIVIRSLSEILTIDLPIDEISQKYLNGMNTYELGEEYKCTRSTITTKLKNNGIDVSTERYKHHSATLQGIPYNEWESLASKKEYCPLFDKECRESNREKYGRMCFLSGLPESKNITKNGKQRKLSVHHVDMNKQQGCNGIRWKLVPLCLEYHGKVHKELWIARITWLINNVWN